MPDPCPACQKGILSELIPGVQQCNVCRKIFQALEKTTETSIESLVVQEGSFFMQHTALNPKWEVADRGVTIQRNPNKSWLAVLICHPPDFPNSHYIRISWWNKSTNMHAGMFRIDDLDELDNVIITLERFDDLFDDTFNPKSGTHISHEPIPARAHFTDSYQTFDEKARECPKCGSKMDRSKNKRYYACERCGEIVILENGIPVMDFPTARLPLAFSENFPVNFYLPGYGITVRSTMAEWRAIVTVYAKENPNKIWLRFYWWTRDFQEYMMSDYSFGTHRGLHWETRKGILSPNIYEKNLLPPLIDGLQKIRTEWCRLKGVDPNTPVGSTTAPSPEPPQPIPRIARKSASITRSSNLSQKRTPTTKKSTKNPPTPRRSPPHSGRDEK